VVVATDAPATKPAEPLTSTPEQKIMTVWNLVMLNSDHTMNGAKAGREGC
jgi:hypothetical protein